MVLHLPHGRDQDIILKRTDSHFLFNAFQKDMISEVGGLEGDNQDSWDLKKAVSKPKQFSLEMGV